MKAWLCLNKVRLQAGEIEVQDPHECLVLLAVFKYKKQGREIFGPNAQFIHVNLPDEGKRGD